MDEGAGTRARRDLVRRGYDAISLAYRDDEGRPNAVERQLMDPPAVT